MRYESIRGPRVSGGMLILTICNNDSPFYFLWLWIMIVVVLFGENILIYWYFWYIAGSCGLLWHWHLFILYLHFPHGSYYICYLGFLSSLWVVAFGFAGSFVCVMSCHIQLGLIASFCWWRGALGYYSMKFSDVPILKLSLGSLWGNSYMPRL